MCRLASSFVTPGGHGACLAMPAADAVAAVGAKDAYVSSSPEAETKTAFGFEGASPLVSQDSPSVLDDLRMAQTRLNDVQEQLNMYRILKSDPSQTLNMLFKMPRRQPGGVPWGRAYSLLRVVSAKKDEPNAAFDEMLDGMNSAQEDMVAAIQHWTKRDEDSRLMAKHMLSEAASAEDDAARLIQKGSALPWASLAAVAVAPPFRSSTCSAAAEVGEVVNSAFRPTAATGIRTEEFLGTHQRCPSAQHRRRLAARRLRRLQALVRSRRHCLSSSPPQMWDFL